MKTNSKILFIIILGLINIYMINCSNKNDKSISKNENKNNEAISKDENKNENKDENKNESKTNESKNTNTSYKYKMKADDKLEATQWKLNKMDGKELIPDSKITISFKEDIVSGSAGCNSYRGNFKTENDNLELQKIMNTEMACSPKTILIQEADYLKILRSVNKYKINKEILELYINEKSVLIYDFVPQKSDLSLENRNWKLVTFAQNGLAFPPSGKANIHIEFKNGKVKGKAGCNSFNGEYTLDSSKDGSKLKLENVRNSTKACPDKYVMENEKVFLDMLLKITHFEINENRLYLKTDNDDFLDFESK